MAELVSYFQIAAMHLHVVVFSYVQVMITRVKMFWQFWKD